MFAHKHLLSIDDLSPEDIMTILKQARTFEEINERPIKKVPALRGKTVCNLFLEPSTRTRGSFELAEKRLSCDSLNAGGSTSSTVKGESLVDTVRTLDSMKVDMFIVRHKCAGAPYIVSQNTNAAVIDAGDGKHQHPTQALLDLYTIWKEKGSFEGLKVGIVGDIAHSRVCGSLVPALHRMGAHVTLRLPHFCLLVPMYWAPMRLPRISMRHCRISMWFTCFVFKWNAWKALHFPAFVSTTFCTG